MPKIQDVLHRASRPCVALDRPKGVRPALQRKMKNRINLYGKSRRLSGRIVGFHYDNLPSRLPGWSKCYGPGGCAACIKIELS